MKEKLAMLKFCKKDFTLQNELHQVIKNNEFVTLEMWCVRLDGRGKVDRPELGFAVGKSEHQEPCMQLPSKGLYCFNLVDQTEFAIPKTHDVINERSLLAGIGYDRQCRRDRIMDLSPW
jgi:hypothetical protein